MLDLAIDLNDCRSDDSSSCTWQRRRWCQTTSRDIIAIFTGNVQDHTFVFLVFIFISVSVSICICICICITIYLYLCVPTLHTNDLATH